MISKTGLAARQAAATVLTRIIDDKRGLDGLLDSRHGPRSVQALDAKDRALVRAIALAACRHRGVISHCLNHLFKRPPPKNARHLWHTLHVAAAQILYLDIPDSAAVDLAVTALRREKRSERFAGLANAVLRRLALEKGRLLGRLPSEEIARLNTPDWLFRSLRKSYGRDRALAIANAHMHEPALDLTVKTDPSDWADRLGGTALFGNTVRLARAGDITQWPGYDQGDWWVQDVSASLPARLMGNIAGLRVADLCAAPGGKTAQLCLAGAEVTAVETSAPRLSRLTQNLARLGLSARCIEADIMEWQPEEPFDSILLDAPCSSTGTIRRHPDVAWTKSQHDVEELAKLQQAMIERAATMVRPGGCLVFSNCSLDRREGEDIVAGMNTTALQLTLEPVTQEEMFGHDEFITRQGTVRTLPCYLPAQSAVAGERDLGGMDGFFAARFRRNG